MVQQVEIPLEWANQIPGVSGVDDVVFFIPELSDIEDAVADLLAPLEDAIEEVLAEILTIPEVQEGLVDVLEDINAGEPLPQAIATAVLEELGETITGQEDFDVPTSEEIAEAVADRVDLSDIGPIEIDIEGSLFAVEQDLVPLLERLFEAADLSGIVEDLPIPDDLPDLVERLLRILDTFQAEIDQFIDDPLGTATGWFLTLLRAVVEEADLVSDEAEQELQRAAEDL